MTREEAIEELKKVDTLDAPPRLCRAHYMAIKALEQESVLDKIRSEIIDKYMTATGEVNTVAKGCLQIIDKYRTESEE